MSSPNEPSAPEPPRSGSPAREANGAARGSPAGRIVQSAVSAVVLVLTCILVPVSVLTVWVHDIVLDTDRYVATMAPLAKNEAVQAAAVHRATEAVAVRVDARAVTDDVADWLESQGLPPRAADAVRGLAPQVDSAIDGAVTKVATRFVESDQFADVWTGANRVAHTAVVHALTGQGRGAVGVSDGTVTLNIGTLVEQIKGALVNAGLSPASKIPEVHKQMVLFHSEELGKIRNAARLLDVLGNWLPVITVLLGAGGVLLARHRRRALAWTALGAAFACLITAIGLVIGRRYYLDHLPAQVQSPAAAAAIFDTVVHFLRVSLRTTIALGIVVALGAYLVGPGRLPKAVRAGSDRTADSAALWADKHRIHTGRTGTWVEANRRWITLGAMLVVVLVFALWNHPTVLTILLLVLILLALLALIALLAAGGRVNGGRGAGAEHPAGPPPDAG
ncbi:hypothetical protein [Streptomyces sp. NPDC090445]|uniref:hypothetical protein n=1 Tax=Streptomyces sp. NPDC090445 TaxID=3365963 RepID=UPI00380EC53C